MDSCSCCGAEYAGRAGYNVACEKCGAVYDANTGKQITLESEDSEDSD